MNKFFVLGFVCLLVFTSCQDDNDIFSDDDIDNINNGNNGNNGTTTINPIAGLNLPTTPHNYANVQLPNHFNQLDNIDNTPNNNPVTDLGATLGRVLFYDVKLSANNSISCASCHRAQDGFSDSRQFSVGFDGGLTGRNSMGLANSKYYNNGRFFWDERANTLETQVLMPIQDHIEMGMTLPELEEKLQEEAYYQYLFELAFGDDLVTSERISRALSQFVRSMVSYQSKYDVGRAQVNDEDDPFPNFTAQENQGKGIFLGRGGCEPCHDTESFVGPNARNNGLDVVYADNGVGAVTGNNNQNGDFKVGSLRNIQLTAPYMHDGRFQTLAQVVEHYNSGVQPHPNLDNRLRNNNGQPRRLNLDQNERNALVAFLNTLTDPSFINDEKFSDPFTE